ncbi:MAG: hypothetical protein AAGA60_19760 [Cyanobacteria bacterium P01_E01_bin.42]
MSAPISLTLEGFSQRYSMMNDRSQQTTHSSLFLHHFSLEEKTRIFQECQQKFNSYRDSIIQQTKERIQQSQETRN